MEKSGGGGIKNWSKMTTLNIQIKKKCVKFNNIIFGTL
jgi:hypothetical protein